MVLATSTRCKPFSTFVMCIQPENACGHLMHIAAVVSGIATMDPYYTFPWGW